jgi:small subunit ribosomal protein S3
VGQKVNPIGYRLGYNKTWNSRWYAEKDYARLLHEDLKIRKMVKERLAHAGVAKIEIERSGNQAKINIHTARPGIIIGRKGAEVDKFKSELETKTGRQIYINIKEIRKPEVEAQLVSENIALQLEKRVAFRRAMKKAVQAALRLGAQGIKITCAGRLGGSEIARTEWYREGRVPLHTLRADIDFGMAEAQTTFGKIGVKVLIYKGEMMPSLPEKAEGRLDLPSERR